MKKQLSNGVRVVYDYMPWIKSVTCGIWIKTGSRNETSKNNGVAHFIEHMLFKGTNKRTARQIANEIDYIGGSINAFTSKEYTCYYTKTLDEHIDIAIDILTDILLNSTFDSKEIEKERSVILEEINMYEDSPEDLVFEILSNNIWSGAPIGYPVSGTKETVSNLTRQDMLDYKNANYTAPNIVISIAGNFNEEKLINMLEEKLTNLQAINNENIYGEEKYSPAYCFKKKEIEQANICFALDGVSFNDDDLYTSMLANNMLGGTMSSILFQKIREEKGLCYSIYSSISPYMNAGNSYIYAGTNPSQALDLINGVCEEIQNFRDINIDEKELKRNKQQLKGNILLSYEGTSTRMIAMGRSEILQKKLITQEEILSSIEAITIEDLNKCIKNIFNLQKLSIGIVGNFDNDAEYKKLYEKITK